MSPKKKGTSYSQENLHQALMSIKNGTPVGRAAKQFHVPRTTLRNKISGKSPMETYGKRGYYSVLGREIEEHLVKWISDAANRGFPVIKDSLLMSVQELNKDHSVTNNFKIRIKPSKVWYYAFFRRHPEIRRKQAEYVNKARGSVTEEKIRKWFRDVLQQLGDDVAILAHPQRVWNMDESGFNLAPTGELVLAAAGRHVYIESRNSDKENITTLFCVNASGCFGPPLTLYKYARLPAVAALSAPAHWALGKTEIGNVFLPFQNEQQIQRPIIVFLDGHKSHLSLQLSEMCRDNGIILVALYPNATHILQPLDVAVFKAIKSRWKAYKRQWRIEHDGNEVTKFDLPSILNKIIQEDQMPNNVVSGFRATGIFPFNENAVDYRKIIQRSPPPAQLLENMQNEAQNMNLTHLMHVESKIDPQKLEDFRATMIEGGPWSGDVADTSFFFYFYRDMVFETYHPNLPPFLTESFVSSDILFEEVLDESILEPLELNGNTSEPHSQEKDPLALPMIWPGPTKSNRKEKNESERLFVTTSQKWVDIHQEKQTEKQKKEMAKAERKRIREEKTKTVAMARKPKKIMSQLIM
ncbi:uncharacterized protein LOC129808661 [Phlebotomus papatasi]|uniref:uncharacterized protein LOC129808661 n=1 Tax=Phlebotomus papatasi TaxID=29031 RepID=UPI0024836277|nr:uncharacterized protein LOC129808661 [Phlebotomus papatasi]